MSRLDDLLALRRQIDEEIEREHAAIHRHQSLANRVTIATTRASWSQQVFNAACKHYGVTADDVLSGRRDRPTLDARHTAMWLMRDAGRTYPEIGNELGMDHTTAINGVRRVEGNARLLATAVSIRAALTGEEAA